MASPPPPSKMHMSPSKGSTTTSSIARTYDAKLVQREMLRLGGSASSAVAGSSSGTPSIGASGASGSVGTGVHVGAGSGSGAGAGHALSLSTQTSMLSLASTATLVAGHGHGHGHGHGLSLKQGGHGLAHALGPGKDHWAQLHVYVLPLFNHERLQQPIEDLNVLVRRHIESVIQRSPSRAIATLENDVAELIQSGMVTLNTKLGPGLDDEKLVGRVVEIWGFFWDQVLPYVEGVFLPLQTDALLINLHRTPRPHRPGSPSMQMQDGASSVSGAVSLGAYATNSPIDVRTIALRAFRDKVILPIGPRLEALLVALLRRDSITSIGNTNTSLLSETAAYHQPRLQQMLLVLHSQARRSPLLTLTGPEALIRSLLNLLAAQRFSGSDMNGNGRDGSGHLQNMSSGIRGAVAGGSGNPMQYRYASPVRGGPDSRRPPSFLSGGLPRDRRGRVAGKMDFSAAAQAAQAGGPPPVPPKDPQHQPQSQQQQGGDAAWRRAGRVLDADDDELDYGQVLSGGIGSSGYGGYGGYGSGYGYGFGSGGGVGSGMSINLSSLSRLPGARPGMGFGSFSGDVMSLGSGDGEDDAGMGMLTPRTRFSVERERDRSFLESLRSPNPVDQDEEDEDEERMRVGLGSLAVGPGVRRSEDGGGGEDDMNDADDERAIAPKSTDKTHVASSSTEVKRSEPTGNGGGPKSGLEQWDEAQAAVERMVGLENGISINRNLSTEKKEDKGEEEDTEDSFATPTATAPPPPPPLLRTNG